MSLYGTADSFLFIECQNELQAKEILLRIEEDPDNQLFDPEIIFEGSNKINLWLKEECVNEDFDLDIGNFAEWLNREYHLPILGHILQEVENSRYRGDFDSENKLNFVELDWISDYTVEQIAEIQKYAQERFPASPSCSEPAEMFCPNCKQTHFVTAKMIRFEEVKAPCLRFPDGRIEIDWDKVDVVGDFEFVCENCGTKLASDSEELKKLINSSRESK